MSATSAALQGVSHFKDIRYTDGITYGEMFMQNEYEMGRYNLEEADVAVQRQRFTLYEQVRAATAAYDALCEDFPSAHRH